MRHATMRAAAAILAFQLACCSPQSGEGSDQGADADAGADIEVRAQAVAPGGDFQSLAQALIDATRAGVVFEAVSNSRFRVVRHKATGFTCWFQPQSEAAVTVVVSGDDVSRAGEDAVCIERSGSAEMYYRIARVPGSSLEAEFAEARTKGAGFLSDDIIETEGVGSFAQSPVPPNVALDIPRLEVVRLGRADGGPAMVRTSVAERPDGWYVTQHYVEHLPQAEPAQLAELALQGSVIAESVFAARLGELVAQSGVPALGQEYLEEN